MLVLLLPVVVRAGGDDIPTCLLFTPTGGCPPYTPHRKTLICTMSLFGVYANLL